MSGRRLAGSVAGAALLIGVLTALARVAGFGRTFVFARTVGQTCLGDTYQSANTVPNVVFEIVAGGALAGVVVPLLAGAVGAGDRERASRVSSALLTWALTALVPLAVLVAVFAEPLADALLGAKSCDGAVAAGAAMLRVFAPQVVLYGVGIVLTGVLQAHRKFGGPAVAPLLSSLVVIATYLLFGALAGPGADVGEVTSGEQLVLSLGTTLGVVVLSLSLLVPLRGTGLRLRPTWTFPAGVARRARRLALSGLAGLVAQQVAVVVALALSNASGAPDGTVTVFLYAQTVYLLPWAILAAPVATSVFPRLAQHAERGDLPAYGAALRPAHRTVVLLAAVATAALVAASREIAVVMVQGQPGVPSVGPLDAGVLAFATGLVGYSLFALMSRALYALGDWKRNALAALLGWAVVVVADLVLAARLDPADRVAALSWGNAIGVTVLGLVLAAAVLHRTGGLGAGLGLAVLAGVVGVAAGLALRRLPLGPLQVDASSGLLEGLGGGLVRGLLAALLAGLVLAAVPGSGVRGLLRRRGTIEDPPDPSDPSRTSSPSRPSSPSPEASRDR